MGRTNKDLADNSQAEHKVAALSEAVDSSDPTEAGVISLFCTKTRAIFVPRPLNADLTAWTLAAHSIFLSFQSEAFHSRSAKTTATAGTSCKCFFIQFVFRMPLGMNHSYEVLLAFGEVGRSAAGSLTYFVIFGSFLEI